MKRLYILRHAKAAPDDGRGDHERPLTDRGRADARRMGDAMIARGYVPLLILCSTAARTVETKDLVLSQLTPEPALHLEDTLYLAPADLLLRIVTRIDTDLSSAMLVGHNPGLEDLAMKLARSAQLAARIHDKFPTCALAVFESSIASWKAANASAWRLLDLIYPADL